MVEGLPLLVRDYHASSTALTESPTSKCVTSFFSSMFQVVL
jgi:hypothetical protein